MTSGTANETYQVTPFDQLAWHCSPRRLSRGAGANPQLPLGSELSSRDNLLLHCHPGSSVSLYLLTAISLKVPLPPTNKTGERAVALHIAEFTTPVALQAFGLLHHLPFYTLFDGLEVVPTADTPGISL